MKKHYYNSFCFNIGVLPTFEWRHHSFEWISIWMINMSLQQGRAIALHICVSESDQHWFRYWLVTYLVSNHYLNQCWVIVNWTLRNKLQWNFNQNTNLFIHKNIAENIVCEMAAILSMGTWVNSLRPRPNRRHFADDIFKRIFENENEWISPRISLKFVPKVRINNIPALV